AVRAHPWGCSLLLLPARPPRPSLRPTAPGPHALLAQRLPSLPRFGPGPVALPPPQPPRRLGPFSSPPPGAPPQLAHPLGLSFSPQPDSPTLLGPPWSPWTGTLQPTRWLPSFRPP